ncbi:sensor histidine kinase [Labrys wisconsinensis]|uniref:histidine kinase n=1 Tax=Labrys wisconsinensis TaxID=425677 RepID=A0ABU0J809_9HYPH|nr:PAS domain-containing sensor histidine kinase [Labrys wisconsinensis]MDQ0469740.1 two-component system cell cycle sensor histidine kinase PleC [Labrys wisconsinensis]
MQKAVPVLILAFLASIAVAGTLQALDARERTIAATAANLDMTVALARAQLARTGAGEAQSVLDHLPAPAPGAVFAVAGHDGTILATTPPRNPASTALLTAALADLGSDRQVATGRRWTGGTEVVLAAGSVEALRIVALRPLDQVLARWLSRTGLMILFVAITGATLLALGAAYYWQASRARRADDIYNAVRARLETALTHGRSGLWDWDLEDGRIYWSDSMFALLGFETRDDVLLDADIEPLIDLAGGDIQSFAREMRARPTPQPVDERFRMRHADGQWICMRARGELVAGPDGGRRLIGIVVDETEERRFAEHARQADERIRDAIGALSEAFVLWDADNRLVICNSKFQQLHRLPDTLVRPGTHYGDLLAAGYQSVVRMRHAADMPCEHDGRTFEAQLADGRWLTINERQTGDGGYVSVGTDITSLKKQQEMLIDRERQLKATIADLKRSRQVLEHQTQQFAELAEKYAEETVRAEAGSRAKSAFLANMSHELRTPLNAIIGFSELMGNGTFGALNQPRYVDYCKDIQASGRYLLEFVDDILEMSKIEAGERELRRERFQLDRLLGEVLRAAKDDIDAKHLTVHAKWPVGAEIDADRRAMRQIMRNLLSNAVKFTPEGGHVGLRMRRRGDRLVVYCEDSGIGIPPQAMKTLGRPFEQVQTQFTKTHSGSGLGLSIAKSLTELHGGALRIRSTVDVGTAVMVTLPVATREERGSWPRDPALALH